MPDLTHVVDDQPDHIQQAARDLLGALSSAHLNRPTGAVPRTQLINSNDDEVALNALTDAGLIEVDPSTSIPMVSLTDRGRRLFS